MSTLKVKAKLNEYKNCSFDQRFGAFDNANDLIGQLIMDFNKWKPRGDQMITMKEEMVEELEFYKGQIDGKEPLTYNQIDAWLDAEIFLSKKNLSKDQRKRLVGRF